MLIGDPGAGHLFTEVPYAGGAVLLHELRERLGDETFFRLLREWAARYRHSNATTEDFIALAKEVSGEDLDAFFTDGSIPRGLRSGSRTSSRWLGRRYVP